ncbi:MAG: amidohydrolase [Anaerolineae bacterium]
MTSFADVVYLNGRIYTVDAKHSWASAVAIKAGEFVYVGNDSGVANYIGPKTHRVDLEGRMVLPGLHDMHIHGVLGALNELYECQFPMASTADEIVEAVKLFAQENPKEAWIVGGAWLMEIKNEIDKGKLDAVCDDRPIFLWDAAHHNGWCNSKMLTVAGITQSTPDPAGGEIVRDPNGEPTGLLLETAAYQVAQSIPDRTPEEYQQGIKWLGEMLHSYGVTSIKEAAVNRSMAKAYKAADDLGMLQLRVGLHFLWITPFVYDPADLELLVMDRHRYAGDLVKVDFLKLFLDGVPVARTACMLEPYRGDDAETHDPYELMLVDRERLKDVLVRFDREGLIVKMHATGDAALRAGLDAIEAARLANGNSGLGHEISHPQNVHPADLPRFAQLGAVADLCPRLWHPSLNKERALIKAVSSEQIERSWPIGSYNRSGVQMIGGTDWPAMMPTANNWPSIQTLITREDPTGQVAGKLGENEEIDLATAIEIFTINGARAARHADVCGSIEVGKMADMIVLDRNLFEIPADQIGGTQVLKTIFNGEVVYTK